jgi:phage gpG-like protein
MVKFEVDYKQFSSAVRRASKQVDDLTLPLTLIAQSWFKSNRAIFQLKGSGKYIDLKEKYKEAKENKYGFTYPILKATGRLETSITNPQSNESINKILNKRLLLLGSKTPYAPFHQFGTRKMPARPFVLIGAEQTAPEALNVRLEAWVKILGDYVAKKTGEAFR